MLLGHVYGFTFDQIRLMPLWLRALYLSGADGFSDAGSVVTQSPVPGLSRSEAEFIGAGG